MRADRSPLVGPVDSEDSPPQQPNSGQGQPANPGNGPQEHAVRFNSVLQEIEPAHSLNTDATLSHDESIPEEPLSPEAQEEIRNLSQNLQQSHLQHRRMSNFAFEPVSLPVSRVRFCGERYASTLPLGKRKMIFHACSNRLALLQLHTLSPHVELFCVTPVVLKSQLRDYDGSLKRMILCIIH